ncbi:hypothetical protein Tco_1357680, partial [Tanacetum coccineum]
MANLPPPDQVADLPEDEPVHPEPAPIILHHAPTQPEGYVGDDDMEEDEEADPDEDPEEELIEQLLPEPNNMDDDDEELKEDGVGDDDEELEEDGVGDDDDEEMEMDENDEDNGRNNDEDDAEVINPYEEVDLFNRPPPTSDEESEFAPPVVPIVDANDEPVPLVIQGVTRLDRQMFDRYKTEKRMTKKFKEDEFCMNRHGYDITALDTEEPPIHHAFAPHADDSYAMIRDAAIAAREDGDDDITVSRDSQPSEPRGSPRDPYMPPKGMSAAAIQKLVVDKVAEVLVADRTTRNNPNVARGSGGNGGQGGAPPVRECTFAGFMKCGP